MTYINLKLFYLGVLAPAILTVILFIGFLICWFKFKFSEKVRTKLAETAFGRKAGIKTPSEKKLQSNSVVSNINGLNFKAKDHTDCMSCTSSDAYITIVCASPEKNSTAVPARQGTKTSDSDITTNQIQSIEGASDRTMWDNSPPTSPPDTPAGSVSEDNHFNTMLDQARLAEIICTNDATELNKVLIQDKNSSELVSHTYQNGEAV